MPLAATSEPEVFVLADRALNKVVAQITDEQWPMQMPPSFATCAAARALDDPERIGVFPPAVPVPQDAPLLDRLLGITGRDPKNP